MDDEEFGQHFEAIRPRLFKRALKRGLTHAEAEDVVQDAAEDLLPKCSRFPNVRALSAAFDTAIDFGLRRARRSWRRRRKLQIEVRAQQGLTGAQTRAAAPDACDWSNEPEHVSNHGGSNLLDRLPGEEKSRAFQVEEQPSEPESDVSDRDRIAYGYDQLSADELGVEDSRIDALARKEIIGRAPAAVRPILERLAEGASYRDVAKEMAINGAALRQRLSRYRRKHSSEWLSQMSGPKRSI